MPYQLSNNLGKPFHNQHILDEFELFRSSLKTMHKKKFGPSFLIMQCPKIDPSMLRISYPVNLYP